MSSNTTNNLDFVDIVRHLEEALALYPTVRVAILFGSAVHHRLTPTSDIDIAIAATRPLASRE